MKRWTVILVLALLLTGCTAQDSTDTTPATTSAPETTAPAPTEPAPDPVSLRTEELDREYLAVAPMGDSLLLFRPDGADLYRDGAVTASWNTALPLPDSTAIRITPENVFWFDSADNSLVTLDATLTEAGRIALPEAVTGDPFISADGQTLYYCTSSGIRIWDCDTQISRNLKLMEGNWLGITGSIQDGAGLRCSLELEDGSIRTMMISSANGETLYEGEVLENLSGVGDFYICVTDQEWIFGQGDQQPQNLLLDNAIGLPQLQMALVITAVETGSELRLIDLNTGLTAAWETLEATDLSAPAVWQDQLVFLNGNLLLCWDYAASAQLYPVTDETVCTAVRYTAQDPDTEGLAALQLRAEALEEQYGIDILMWTDVTEVQPVGYVFGVEHRTQIYEEALNTLETALARLPEDFLEEAAAWTDDGTVHLVLTRSVTAPVNSCSISYLLDWNGYIILTLDDTLEEHFYHGLGHILDTQVLSHSDAFYEWYTVNPSGFAYDNDYDGWQDRESKYLSGSKRYFVNSLSMTFPVEDRATLFAAAMMAGQEEVFETDAMQTKLERLKTGLRETFDLEGDSYPWEQYLK